MREYVGVAFNDLLVVGDDKITARAEVVILSSEPRWESDIAGLKTSRVVVEHRVLIRPNGLRQMADALVKQADALDRLDGVLSGVAIPKGAA